MQIQLMPKRKLVDGEYQRRSTKGKLNSTTRTGSPAPTAPGTLYRNPQVQGEAWQPVFEISNLPRNTVLSHSDASYVYQPDRTPNRAVTGTAVALNGIPSDAQRCHCRYPKR